VFSNGTFFAETCPMARKADAGQALKTIVMKLGVLEALTVDGSKEQTIAGTESIARGQRWIHPRRVP
jgi:hypothetical protein